MPTNKPGYMKAYRQAQAAGQKCPLCTCGKQLKGKLSKERLTCSLCWQKSDEGKAETLRRVREHRRKQTQEKEPKSLTMSYPYASKIKVMLSIGYSGAEREDFISPKDSSYTESEWNALTEQEREDWVIKEADEWAQDYIEIDFAVVKP